MANQDIMIVVPNNVRVSNANIGTAEKPVYMDRSAAFWIPKRDKIKLTEDLVWDGKTLAKKGELTEIRHIKDCQSAYVLIQKILGEEPTDKDYIRVDNINSTGTFRNEGLQVGLFEYLKICNYNNSNPNKLKKKTSWFKEMDTEKDAIAYVENEVERYEAMNLVWSLYNKHSKVYNEEKISYYAALLKIGAATPSEKFVALQKMAQTDPKKMMHVIDSSKGDILAVIDRAFKANILVLGEFAVENSITKLPVITSEKKMTMGLAEERLMVYFSTEEGKIQFENINKAIKKKKNVLETA